MTILTTIWNDLLDFIFPRYCVICSSKLISGEEAICIECLFKLPKASHFGRNDNAAVMRLVDLGFPLQAASLYTYGKGESVQKLIFSLKYSGNKNLAFMMGKLMAKAAQAWPEYSAADFLVPVPLHKRKEKQRGYNQAEWLCRGISSIWGTPIASDALIRRVATDAQASKSNLDRRQIMDKNVFVANGSYALKGKNLLLVDDVLTTGSTIVACATPLLEIQDVRLCVFTLAIA